MSTQSSQRTGTATESNHAVTAGVIGAILTVVLYWITLALAGSAIVTASGASITIIIAAFITGYLGATYANR